MRRQDDDISERHSSHGNNRSRHRLDDEDILWERRTSPHARMQYLEDQSRSKTRHMTFQPTIEAFRRPRSSQGNRGRSEFNPLSESSPRSRAGQGSGPRKKREFGESLTQALDELENDYRSNVTFKHLQLEASKLEAEFGVFKYKMLQAVAEDSKSHQHYARLKLIFGAADELGFQLEVKYAFYGHLIAPGFSKRDMDEQQGLANLRYPADWYPGTRARFREMHLHVGPTNSGKTYHALKRLEQAESGLYAGPLRLLAHEVYTRLNAAGKACNLVTGDDRRAAEAEAEAATMAACTVEMIPLNPKIDVAVIDEIQMIGSEDRGWAWTQAVLGVKAREVHMCGEARSVPIIRALAALTGDELHVHHYQRLSPLKMMDKSLDGNLRALQKGDCIVAFSIMEIHGLRQLIEKTLKCKVAVIYGSLPPETRAQQAQLFNDPDSGYDILVASNAIGMGLNLSIKRLIFHTAHRFNGSTYEPLSVAEAKQIAGRAGRYRTAAQAIKKDQESNLDITATRDAVEVPAEPTVGLVTTLDKIDFPIIERAMASEPEPLVSAGIQPPAYIIERFARLYPQNTPFAYLLIRLHELSRTSTRFHLCDFRSAISIADAIHTVEDLTTSDRLIMVSSPIECRKAGEPALARAYARLVAANRGVQITDMPELDLELLGDNYTASRKYLSKLETLHKAVIIWMWLSYRFIGVFINRELAVHVKSLVEQRIEDTLQRLAFDFDKLRKRREQAIQQMLARQSETTAESTESDLDGVPHHTEAMSEDNAGEHDVEQAVSSTNTSQPLDGDVEVEEQVLSTAEEPEIDDESLIADISEVTAEDSSEAQGSSEHLNHYKDQGVSPDRPDVLDKDDVLSPHPAQPRNAHINTNFFL